MLLKLEGFKCGTALDLNMGYYFISLCTIILTWVKYRYKNVTMGVSNPPENFQEKMNEIFCGF